MEAESTALLIVDMMNDHIHPEGAAHRFGVGMPEASRQLIVGNNQRLLAAARSAGLAVIHIRNEYRWDNLDCGTSDARKRDHRAAYPPDVPYKIIGTWGAQIIDDLAPTTDEVVVVKKNQSAFWFSELDQILRHLGVETMITTGGATTGCLNDTVREGAGLGYEFLVVTDAVYQPNHPVLPSLQHACTLTSTDEMLETLTGWQPAGPAPVPVMINALPSTGGLP
jgi:ureidoacrylate peracid hydrolase